MEHSDTHLMLSYVIYLVGFAALYPPYDLERRIIIHGNRTVVFA